MNKEELIVKAREAILKGEKKVEGYYIYTAKIDLDEKLEDGMYIYYWECTRKAIIEFFGDIVVDINTSKTERGLHTVIHYLCKVDLSEEKHNLMQLLLGDDIVRYKINKRRIERGINWEKANILFSRILERYPNEGDSRIKIALERIVGEVK